jgi:hypothetical protein
MLSTIVSLMLTLLPPQAGSQPFVGTWIAELDGTRYVRLELRLVNGKLGGTLALGNIEVDDKGDVRAATAAPDEPTPIFEVAQRGSTLSFARKDSTDVDHFELTFVGDRPELRFIPTEADRKELAAEGIPVPKPIRLRKLEP